MDQFLNCHAPRPQDDSTRPKRKPSVMENKQDKKEGNGPSRPKENIYSFLSQHAQSLVVAVLFLATLITLSVYVQTHEKPDPAVVSIFSTVLAGLIAYFAATRRSGQNK
jgi:hypothetical protein